MSELLFIFILYNRVKGKQLLTFFAFAFSIAVKFKIAGKVLEIGWEMLLAVFMKPVFFVKHLGSDFFCAGKVGVDAKVGIF